MNPSIAAAILKPVSPLIVYGCVLTMSHFNNGVTSSSCTQWANLLTSTNLKWHAKK